VTRLVKGSPYKPDAKTVDRIIVWYRGCMQGLSTREIAEQLGIKVPTLRRAVLRARQHGMEGAIRHPNATAPGDGLSCVISPSARIRHLRFRRRRDSTPAA
jgi:hypothetical protein